MVVVIFRLDGLVTAEPCTVPSARSCTPLASSSFRDPDRGNDVERRGRRAKGRARTGRQPGDRPSAGCGQAARAFRVDTASGRDHQRNDRGVSHGQKPGRGGPVCRRSGMWGPPMPCAGTPFGRPVGHYYCDRHDLGDDGHSAGVHAHQRGRSIDDQEARPARRGQEDARGSARHPGQGSEFSTRQWYVN